MEKITWHTPIICGMPEKRILDTQRESRLIPAQRVQSRRCGSLSGEMESALCTNFVSDDVVCTYEESNFLVGNVDRYTIVIWMEGDDPECVDAIIGGSVEFSMHIDADYDDETNLLWKFVTDIKDTLTNDKPIDAAGNEAPNDSYYSDHEITWDTRRNQQFSGRCGNMCQHL